MAGKVLQAGYRVLGILSAVCTWCSAAAIASIALLNTVDSLGRYLLGRALFGASEWVSVLMSIFVFGGLCLAIRTRKGISVPVVLEAMQPGPRQLLMGVGNFLCSAAAALMASQLFLSAQRHYANPHLGSDMIKVPYWPLYFFATFAVALVALEFLGLAIRDIRAGFLQTRSRPNAADAAREEGNE